MVQVNMEEAPPCDELFVNAVDCGTVEDTHPEEIVVDDVHAHGVMKHIQQYNYLQASPAREQPHFASRSTLELEVMCCPSVYSNVSTQTGSAQLACPLAWTMSAPS